MQNLITVPEAPSSDVVGYRQAPLQQQVSWPRKKTIVILFILSFAIFVISFSIVTPPIWKNNPIILTASGLSFLISIALYIITCIVLLIKQAKQRQWIWFVCTLIFGFIPVLGGIYTLIYLIAAPEMSQPVRLIYVPVYQQASSLPVAIRRVRIEDAANLQTNCFPSKTLEKVQQQIENSLSGMVEDQWLHIVAEMNGIIVGSAELKRETPYAEWINVVVSKQDQEHDIASALLQATLAQAASWGAELLTVKALGGTPAEELYHRLGFYEHGRLPGGFRENALVAFDDVTLALRVPNIASLPS